MNFLLVNIHLKEDSACYRVMFKAETYLLCCSCVITRAVELFIFCYLIYHRLPLN